MGRKTKLNRSMIKEVKSRILQGDSDTAIFQRVDAPKSTWTEWKQRGEEETSGIYHELSVSFDRSVAELEGQDQDPDQMEALDMDLEPLDISELLQLAISKKKINRK
jgi:hypothetical protein